MFDWLEASEEDLKRERAKARELRQSQWWKNRIAKGVCHYCGAQLPPKELTLDHIVPLVRGGKSSRGNCVPACKECNSKKQALTPVEWAEYLEKLAGQEKTEDRRRKTEESPKE